MLVLRALGLGDLLTAVPALRGAAPGAGRRTGSCWPRRPVLAPLARLTGAVDAVLPHAGLADGPLPDGRAAGRSR